MLASMSGWGWFGGGGAHLSTPQGHAPIKVQHFSGREIGVNIKYLGTPCCTNEKLNGFELGGCHPFQIR